MIAHKIEGVLGVIGVAAILRVLSWRVGDGCAFLRISGVLEIA